MSPLVIAHRGVYKQRDWPENTVRAFQAAVEAKADMIELDIHETKDGQLLVFHDDRLNGDALPWTQLTYNQVKQLTGDSDRAPLLRDALAAIGQTPVDAEIKQYIDVNNLYKQLTQLPKGSIISSFNLQVLKELNKRKIQYPLFLIISESARRPYSERLRNRLMIRWTTLLPKYLAGLALQKGMVNVKIMSLLKNHGKQIFVWTVNKEVDIQGVTALGVEGIITDYPRKVKKQLISF